MSESAVRDIRRIADKTAANSGDGGFDTAERIAAHWSIVA